MVKTLRFKSPLLLSNFAKIDYHAYDFMDLLQAFSTSSDAIESLQQASEILSKAIEETRLKISRLKQKDGTSIYFIVNNMLISEGSKNVPATPAFAYVLCASIIESLMDLPFDGTLLRHRLLETVTYVDAVSGHIMPCQISDWFAKGQLDLFIKAENALLSGIGSYYDAPLTEGFFKLCRNLCNAASALKTLSKSNINKGNLPVAARILYLLGHFVSSFITPFNAATGSVQLSKLESCQEVIFPEVLDSSNVFKVMSDIYQKQSAEEVRCCVEKTTKEVELARSDVFSLSKSGDMIFAPEFARKIFDIYVGPLAHTIVRELAFKNDLMFAIGKLPDYVLNKLILNTFRGEAVPAAVTRLASLVLPLSSALTGSKFEYSLDDEVKKFEQDYWTVIEPFCTLIDWYYKPATESAKLDVKLYFASSGQQKFIYKAEQFSKKPDGCRLMTMRSNNDIVINADLHDMVRENLIDSFIVGTGLESIQKLRPFFNEGGSDSTRSSYGTILDLDVERFRKLCEADCTFIDVQVNRLNETDAITYQLDKRVEALTILPPADAESISTGPNVRREVAGRFYKTGTVNFDPTAFEFWDGFFSYPASSIAGLTSERLEELYKARLKHACASNSVTLSGEVISGEPGEPAYIKPGKLYQPEVTRVVSDPVTQFVVKVFGPAFYKKTMPEIKKICLPSHVTSAELLRNVLPAFVTLKERTEMTFILPEFCLNSSIIQYISRNGKYEGRRDRETKPCFTITQIDKVPENVKKVLKDVCCYKVDVSLLNSDALKYCDCQPVYDKATKTVTALIDYRSPDLNSKIRSSLCAVINEDGVLAADKVFSHFESYLQIKESGLTDRWRAAYAALSVMFKSFLIHQNSAWRCTVTEAESFNNDVFVTNIEQFADALRREFSPKCYVVDVFAGGSITLSEYLAGSEQIVNAIKEKKLGDASEKVVKLLIQTEHFDPSPLKFFTFCSPIALSEQDNDVVKSILGKDRYYFRAPRVVTGVDTGMFTECFTSDTVALLQDSIVTSINNLVVKSVIKNKLATN